MDTKSPSVESPFGFLLGAWSGSGRGEYPTIESFSYNERVTFALSPKGFVAYQQTTSHPLTGAPMHSESGYLRRDATTDSFEFIVAQPTGIAEIHRGTLTHDVATGYCLNFESASVTTSPSAKSVTAVQRRLVVLDDVLSYRMSMAAVGLPLQHHLAAELVREQA